jgi:hypothetical protein
MRSVKLAAEMRAAAAVMAASQDDPETLEISMDTKAKVSEGEYSRGGKNADGVGRDDGQGSRP